MNNSKKLLKHFAVLMSILLILAIYFIACNSGGGGDDNGGGNDGATVEGDYTGIIYLDNNTVECVGTDAIPISGDSVYVSPNGDDSNDGATESAPFKTLAKALCNMGNGQTVYLAAGTYTDSVIMAVYGNSASTIKIIGVPDANGNRPVLDGEKLRSYGIAMVNSFNIEVKNLEFKNFGNSGLYIGLTDGVTIENCIFSFNGFHSVNPDADGEGFGLEVADDQNVLIKNNESHNNGPEEALFLQGTLGMGIDTFTIENGQVINNKVYNNIGGGILVEDGVNVTVDNNEIYGNTLRGGHPDEDENYWDGGIWVDGGHDVTVTNNNIHDNTGPAVTVTDTELQYPYGSCKYTITDNILVDNYWAFSSFNFLECPMPADKYNIIFNNNTVSGNSYPGTYQESIDGTDATLQVLCVVWPCGENTPCVPPESGRTVNVCE